MKSRPLVFFWIAEFTDGTAVSQFDPDTGEEVKANPEWLPSKTNTVPVPEHWKGKRVRRIGWYPFSLSLAKKVYGRSGTLCVPSFVKPVVVGLGDGEEPVCYRTHRIDLNLGTGGAAAGEAVYVLGVKGGKVLRINEDGEAAE